MIHLRTRFLFALLLVALALPSFGQSHPMPKSASESLAICNGCPETNASGEANDGLPTWPYDTPLADHVGRLTDSSDVKAIQCGYRTARSGIVRAAYDNRGSAPPRLYMRSGEAMLAYSTDSFIDAVGNAPSAVSALKTKLAVAPCLRNPLERMNIGFDAWLYAEAKGTGWITPLTDGQERLFDFDWDDRGYVYAAMREYGWGIVSDTGQTGGANFPKVSQVYGSNPADTAVDDAAGISPVLVVTAAASGKYYAAIGSKTFDKLAIWDVTTPSAPKLKEVRERDNAIRNWAKDYENDRIAVITSGGTLKIYTHAQFAGGSSPEASFTAASGKYFNDLAFDDRGRLWVAEAGLSIAPSVLIRIVPDGSGDWTRSVHSVYPYSFQANVIHAWAGYVVVGGKSSASGATSDDVVIFKLSGSDPVYVDNGGFFYKYYHRSPRGYAEPGSYANNQKDVHIFKDGTKTYLIYQAHGLGDVYQLGESGPSLNTIMKTTSYGTVNPNSQQTVDGPFPGDKVTFRSTASTGASMSLDWSFGNSEAGSDNSRSGSTGADIVHQFSGLNTTTKINATKSVTATAASDSSLSDSVAVSLTVPVARIAIASTGELVTASGFKVVAGEKFADASDGSVESHFATWNVSGTVTEAEPDEEVSVGPVGSRTVSLTGRWGKYNPATFDSSSPYEASVSSKSYTVVPFLATLKPLVRGGGNVTFDGEAQFSTDDSILDASLWTVLWTLKAPGGAVSDTQSDSVPPSTNLPEFIVDDGLVVNGSVITLKITVATGAVATGFESFEVSQTLAVPDPVVQLTGCLQVGDPCSVKAISASGASITPWQLSWSIKRGTTTVKTGTTNPISPSLSVAGNYTATVTETAWNVSASKNFEVIENSCGAPPLSSQMAISVDCDACATNTDIRFHASLFTYALQDCDEVVWTFGDGQTATGRTVLHKYTTAKTYTVKLTIKNDSDSTGTSITKSVQVGGGSPEPEPDTCNAPTGVNFTYSGSRGCSASKDCQVGEKVTFTPVNAGSNLQSCDAAAWVFGDGGTSGSKKPSYTYDGTGNFTVELIVSNTKGTAPKVTKTLKIVPAVSSGNCSTAPTEANLIIGFTGQSSNCKKTGGECARGETVQFEAKSFGYTFQECDEFLWDFGDGSTSTDQNPTHAFLGTASSFAVTLLVQNSAGGDDVSVIVPVSGGAPIKPVPVLTLTTFPTTGAKGSPVTFVASSSLGTTNGWTWTFGDGTSDTTQAGTTQQFSTVTHVFGSTGDKTVKVTARNSEDIPSAPTGSAQNKIKISEATEIRYLLPVVAHITGQGGSVWKTDVQIYNPDTTVTQSNPLVLKAIWNGTEVAQLGITKSTHIYEDFLFTLIGKDGAGPVILTTTAKKPPQIWTRTYNQTDHGTYGQFIPAILLDQPSSSAATSGRYHLAGLLADSRYRTNVGFVNPTTTAMDAAITIRDDHGAVIKSCSKTLVPFQFSQGDINGVCPGGTTVSGAFSVQVTAPTGKWLVAYASLIDSFTDDPVFFNAVEETEVASEDYKTVLLPGVSHTGHWRSDTVVYNPDATVMVGQVEYIDMSGTARGVPGTVLLNPGGFVQWNDLLKQGILGDVPDGAGYLKFTVQTQQQAYPLMFARTYADNGAGGSYGQGIPAFPLARANVKLNAPALVPGVRDDENYYTNVGLLNLTAAPTVVAVSVLNPQTGLVVKTQQYALAPGQMTLGRFFLDATPDDEDVIRNGTLKVDLISGGNVWAFVSVIDKQTFDPEYIPAFPLIP